MIFFKIKGGSLKVKKNTMPVFSYYKNKALLLKFRVPKDADAVECGVFQVCTNRICEEYYVKGTNLMHSKKASSSAGLELRKKEGDVLQGRRGKKGLWTFPSSAGPCTLKCYLKECNSNLSPCPACRRKLSCVVQTEFVGSTERPYISQVYFVQSSPQRQKRKVGEVSEVGDTKDTSDAQPLAPASPKRQRTDDEYVTREEFLQFQVTVQDVFQRYLPAVYKHRIFCKDAQLRFEEIEQKLEQHQDSPFFFSEKFSPLPIEYTESMSDCSELAWEEVEKELESFSR